MAGRFPGLRRLAAFPLPIVLAAAACTPDTQTAPARSHTPPNFSAQNVGRPWSFQVRGNTQRFEVRAADHLPGDGSDADKKERSEAYLRNKAFDIGKTYQVSFDLMIEPGPPNTAKWLILCQFQSNFDKGEPGHSPPLAIGLGGDRLMIVSRYSATKISAPNDFVYTEQYKSPAPLKRGKWYKLAMTLRFDPFGDGQLTVTIDGKQILDYHGAIGFNDDVGPYFKEGIYRAAAPESLAVNFRNLTIDP